MKQHCLIVIFFFLITIKAEAQQPNWIEQKVETGAHFISTSFINENEGWVIGRLQGHKTTILKTTDGGETWIIQQNELNVALTSVYFTDPLNGWAVGENGVIIYTVDGGTNWYFQNSGTTYHLNSVFFINSEIGWIVGIFGK